MTWTDDEKRAALGLLARIATGIETLIEDSRRAMDPANLASVYHTAMNVADEAREADLFADRDKDVEGDEDDDEDGNDEPKEH